ncbi:Uncharacterized protein FWK35_00006673 [Aphis craccivora]|uniref:Uncharacterized protein n=1 Tax=Aphis craccivora TaxID=307492 RepID=A0A6G0YSF1_APHCR|nr:Uncharacterized protein FWK35_00006673 [Aphis craccivora]
MSQVKECLQTQSFECSILPNAVPKACLQKVEKKTCRFENINACQALKKSNVSDVPFTDDSVYNHSYYHHDVCENRTEPVVHKDHLVMAGQFQDQTSHRKVVPKNNCLGGQGPMRMMTTQQHDYYGPCNYDGLGCSKKIVRSDSLVINSDCPMVGLTTNSCSYQPVYAKREKNFKPNQCYKEPGAYTYKDNCGNTANLMVDSNLAKNCCPLTCLADNVDSELKSKFTKAHHFDD